MLDDQNYLNQFKIGAGFETLEKIFDDDFVSQAPTFSPSEAVFTTENPTYGLKLGLKLLNNTNFKYKTYSKKTENELIILTPQANQLLDNWHQLLIILKTGGVDIYNELTSLKSVWRNLSPTTPTTQNPSKQLALRLAGKIILLLHSENNENLSHFIKWQFEQFSKNLTFTQNIHYLNHKGWLSHPIAKPFGVIDLISNDESKSTISLFQSKNQRLSGKMPASYILKPSLETKISQILELALIGQTTAFYLASLNKQSLTKELF